MHLTLYSELTQAWEFECMYCIYESAHGTMTHVLNIYRNVNSAGTYIFIFYTTALSFSIDKLT